MIVLALWAEPMAFNIPCGSRDGGLKSTARRSADATHLRIIKRGSAIRDISIPTRDVVSKGRTDISCNAGIYSGDENKKKEKSAIGTVHFDLTDTCITTF